MHQKVKWLYEQNASQDCIARYLQCWLSWVKAGLGDCTKTILKPLTKSIHSIYKAVEIGQSLRISPEVLAILIAQ